MAASRGEVVFQAFYKRLTREQKAAIATLGEELREAPDSAQALSVLFEQKIQVIDARMAELATLRAELATRVDTGCPLRAIGRPS